MAVSVFAYKCVLLDAVSIPTDTEEQRANQLSLVMVTKMVTVAIKKASRLRLVFYKILCFQFGAEEGT